MKESKKKAIDELLFSWYQQGFKDAIEFCTKSIQNELSLNQKFKTPDNEDLRKLYETRMANEVRKL